MERSQSWFRCLEEQEQKQWISLMHYIYRFEKKYYNNNCNLPIEQIHKHVESLLKSNTPESQKRHQMDQQKKEREYEYELKRLKRKIGKNDYSDYSDYDMCG